MTENQTEQKREQTSFQRFKTKHPNYFKEYYKKNKEKFIQNGKKRKTTWYGIEIFGTRY